jgi:hypothetical protein
MSTHRAEIATDRAQHPRTAHRRDWIDIVVALTIFAMVVAAAAFVAPSPASAATCVNRGLCQATGTVR